MPGPYTRPSHSSPFNDGSATDATVLLGEMETSLELVEGSVAGAVPGAAQARTNLGLGTAATTAASAYDVAGAAASAQAAAIAASQPVDSDLTAIAALTTTIYGRSLLTLADAAAGRTSLGLGTAATTAASAYDVAGAAAAAQAASQPLDSDLTAIAALTTTIYGRAFLALADAAAGRTALGLGTAATQASTAFDASGAAASAQSAAIAASAQRASNLSDLASAATARTNLGLGGAAVLSVGTTAGTVAAGDDSRFGGSASIPDTFNITAYGATTGASDNTTAVQAAIAAAYANGGGIVYVPSGTFICTGQLSIPGGVSTGQVAITIKGCAPQGIAMANIEASDPTTGSVLDLHYSDAGASGKIVALYEGIFGLKDIRIGCTDATKDDTPLIYSTMPQPRFDSVTFFGNTTHRTTACVQDAIVLGGTGTSHAENSTSSPFSGYGGFIRGCSFWAIRKHTLFQNWVNGVVVEGNLTDRSSCGSSETNSAPYVIDTSGTTTSYFAMGNVFQNNTIEVEQYNYAFRFKNNAQMNSLRGNGIWDPGAGILGLAYVEESSGCTNNWLIFDGYTHPAYQTIGGITIGSGLNVVHKIGTDATPVLYDYKPASWKMYLNGATNDYNSMTYDSAADGPLLSGYGGVGIKSAGRNQKIGLYVGSGTPEGVVTATMGSAYFNVAGGASTSFYVKESGAGNTGWIAYGAPGGGGGSLTSTSNYLASDVTMTTAGTYYDGPSVTLAAGTWLLTGSAQLTAVSVGVRRLDAKLWDGTTLISNATHNVEGTASASQASLAVSAIVTPSVSTTYKISCSSTVNADTFRGTSTNGSYLLAVKIA